MQPRKRKNVEESVDNDAKKMRTSSSSPQEINFSKKYSRTRDSNIKFNHPPKSTHSNHHSHKLKSFDLVEHVFGSLVSIRVAATILLAFLQLKLVQVHSQSDGTRPTSPEDQIDACINAAVVLHTSLYHNQSHDVQNLYEWEWSPYLDIGTESGAAMFLNTVAVIAHRVILAVGVSPGFTDRPIKTLWTTVPQPNDPSVHQRECNQTPSSSSNNSDKASLDKAEQVSDPLPSIVTLPIEAFIVSNDSVGPSDEMRRPSVYCTIDSIFANLSANSIKKSPSTTSPTNELERCENIADLRAFLRSHVEKLSMGVQDFSHFRQNQVKPEFMCFEDFVATGLKARTMDTQDEFFSCVSQELSFMQRQHTAQPHSRFVLGLVIIGNRMTLCRGDSIGTEECTFDLRTGSGMLEAIQLALGFAVADNETLGYDPAFELEKEFGGYSLLTREGGGKMKIGEGINHDGVVYVPKYYNTPPDSTGKSERYYLHYLVDNHGSFQSRMTRVWCAYRQVESMEEITNLVHPDDQMEAKILLMHKEKAIFVGPYALKYQNVDTSSITSKENVVQRIMEAMEEEMKVVNDNERTGVECILLPQHLYKRANILHTRGFTEEGGIPRPVAKLSPRQNVITISLFKRTLSQYEDFDEVVRAITDGYRAINWLHSKGFLHRDISDGNLLLSREKPTEFKKPFSPQIKVVLFHRKDSSPNGIYGILHDFDLAGPIHVTENDSSIIPLKDHDLNSSVSYEQRMKGDQIGTSPYMSIRVLRKTLGYHTIADDMESLFYILYLFPFSNTRPKPTSYPLSVPDISDNPKWPYRIKEWTVANSVTSLEYCGRRKFGFFTDKSWILDDPRLTKNKHFKKNWSKGSKDRTLWERLVNVLHNEFLFYDPYPNPLRTCIEWRHQPWDVIASSITNMIKTLDEIITKG